MFKKWMSAALLAGWLGLGTSASAQYQPTPYGPARTPEPLPCAPGPNLTPGPISPLAAPQGPPEDLSLPANQLNAFPCEELPDCALCYFHFGTQALKRQGIGSGVVAFSDRGDVSRLDSGRLVRFNDVVPRQDLEMINPSLVFGPKVLAGYLQGNWAIEFSGYYIPQDDTTISVSMPGMLNLFFFNVPLGFEGNNGLFRQADRVTTTFQSALWNAEVNVRYFSKAVTGCEPMVGVRYMDLRERLGISVDDDGITFPDVFGGADLTRTAEYASRTINQLIIPQVGLEYQHQLVHGLVAGFHGKAGAGVNFAQSKQTVRRGEGLTGSAADRFRTNFAQVFEGGVFFDVYALERARFRAGYTALFVNGVLEAPDQVRFDLSAPNSNSNNSGSVFYHGPSIELQLLF